MAGTPGGNVNTFDSGAYVQMVNVKAFGATGNGTTDDTAAIQAAINSATGGYLFFPSGTYLVTSTLTVGQSTVRNFTGAQAKILFTGTGYCFSLISASPGVTADQLSFISFYGLVIDGTSSATPTGAITMQGCFDVQIDHVTVQNFTNASGLAVKIQDCYNVESTGLYVTNVPNCVQLGGSTVQITNVEFRNFLWHPNAGGYGIQIATGIQGGGLSLGNGAIKVSSGGVAIDWTGQFAGVKLGPSFHIECYDAAGSNTTTAIYLHGGSSLFCGSLSVDGVDFYNLQTLMHLDAGAGGSIFGVTVGTFYASGLAGLAGTVFNLNITSLLQVTAQPNVNSAQYTTYLTATSTGQLIRAPYINASLPSPDESHQGQIATKINASGDQTYVCQRNSSGTYSFVPIMLAPAVTSQTAAYATKSSDRGVIAASGTWTLTLTTLLNGQEITVRNNGAGTITVAASSGTVNGTTSLAAGAHAVYQCDGTNWNQIA